MWFGICLLKNRCILGAVITACKPLKIQIIHLFFSKISSHSWFSPVSQGYSLFLSSLPMVFCKRLLLWAVCLGKQISGNWPKLPMEGLPQCSWRPLWLTVGRCWKPESSCLMSYVTVEHLCSKKGVSSASLGSKCSLGSDPASSSSLFIHCVFPKELLTLFSKMYLTGFPGG